MPKIVDHDERRRELAEAALRVIGRGGLESATTRAVAEESGWSTGVLKHYYTDKDELLGASLRELERLNVERFQIAQHQQTGFDAIRACVSAILRGDPRESQLWIAFMARAASSPQTAKSMRHAIEVWVARWSELIDRGQRDGSIRADLDPNSVAVELHALVNGLRIRDQFRPPISSPRWPIIEDDLAILEGLRPDNPSRSVPSPAPPLSDYITPDPGTTTPGSQQ